MAKGSNRLTAGHLKKKGPAKLCDGGGLWLFITDSNARRWVFRYRFEGRDFEMGLGSLLEVSLEEARSLASEFRQLKKTRFKPYPQQKTS
jgi:hypothetical protein